jgi:glutathione S-transferase
MFEATGLASAQGCSNYFVRYSPDKVPLAIEKFTGETKRLYNVLNKHLEGKEYIVGNRFTLADAICYPWVRSHFFSGVEKIDEFTNLTAWVARIDARPATQKGLNVPITDQIKEYREHPEKLEEFEKLVQEFFRNKKKNK